MKVIILGAGAVGSVIAKFLSEDKEIKQVVCADKNLSRAKQFVNFKNKKLSLMELDITDSKKLVSVLKDSDLVINASLPRFNGLVLKACLEAKANYQDLCSYLDKYNKPEQLAFDAEFKKAGLVGLINTGMSPGVTNLLARNAADDFDSIDYIKIRTLQHQNSVQPIFALSPEIILEESTEPSLVYRNKKFEFVQPFSEVEEYDFPFPSGKKFVFSVYGDEIATLPRYINVNNVDFRASGNDIESAKALFDLGLLQKEPIKIGESSFVPLDFISKGMPDVPTPKEMLGLIKKGVFKESEVVIAVELLGKKFGKKISLKSSVRFPSTAEINKIFPGATYISFPTGLSAYCFSKIIPKTQEKGIYPPEALNPEKRHNALLELAANGIQFNEKLAKV